jgi:alpha-L-fucosidase 2
MLSPNSAPSPVPSRRSFLALTGATAAGSLAALAGFPVFAAAAAEPIRPAADPRIAAGEAVRLWYSAPAAEQSMIQQGLPIGNGRLGALVSGNPGQGGALHHRRRDVDRRE